MLFHAYLVAMGDCYQDAVVTLSLDSSALLFQRVMHPWLRRLLWWLVIRNWIISESDFNDALTRKIHDERPGDIDSASFAIMLCNPLERSENTLGEQISSCLNLASFGN